MESYKKHEPNLQELALNRVAKLFNLQREHLKPEYCFGIELKASFVSDFKENELDQINNDIHDVADRSTKRDIQAGRLKIYTVEDYCNYIVNNFEKNPKEIKAILGIK